MPQENLHNLQGEEQDTTQIYGDRSDKNVQSQINAISRTLDRVVEHLSVIEVQPLSARQSRVTPLLEVLGATGGYNPLFAPDQAQQGARRKSTTCVSQDRDQVSVGPDPFRVSAEPLEFSEIQEDFNSVKSSTDKVILPPSLKVHDSRSGIKKDDQQTLNVITKCSRYIETALKLISRSKEGSPLDIEQLLVCLIAQIKYLQDEYAALLVKGKFDQPTAQLLRSLQRNNSGFDNQSINNVRIAAELASIAQSSPQSHSRSQNYYSCGRGGFNRGYRGNYRGFGSFRGNRDIFHSLRGQSRSGGFPQNRESDDS